MKAVRLYGKDDLRVEDVATPSVSDGDVLVRVQSALICGTDLRMYANGRAGEDASPLILGHEMSGVIESVGTGVNPVYESGARVAVAPNIGCGVCRQCVSGNTQMCESMKALGINIDGGLAEFVRIPSDAVRQGTVSLIPDDMSFEEAALVEPFSCVYNAFERVGARPDDTVLIIGAGPIGFMHAKLFSSAGVASVLIHDLNQNRLDYCLSQDPSLFPIGPGEVERQVLDLTRGAGADVIVTATPAPAAQALALELAAVNARVVFFGGLPRDREVVPLNTNFIHYKQLTVTGTTRQNLRQYRTSLEMIAKKQVDVAPIVTKKFTLDSAIEAFDHASSRNGLKTGFEF